MRKGFLGSLAVLAAGAGLTLGQSFTPPGPGGPPPGPLPGTVPPAGQTMGNPPPGVAPYAYSGPSGANAGYGYVFPDGNPAIMPPGMEGMIPPGSMGAGAPGGVYGDGLGGGGMGMDGMDGGYGSGKGLLSKLLGHGGPPRFWAGAEYLFWAPKSWNVNYPLVTTSAPADLGVLGQPTTVSLCGAVNDITFDGATGYRAWAGMAIGGDGMMGVEVGGFFVEPQTKAFRFAGNGGGVPVLAVPFYDLGAGGQGSYIVSFPGVNSGSITMQARTQVLGGEVNGVYNLYPAGDDGPGGLTLLAGARYLSLEEQFQFDTSSTTFGVPPAGAIPPGPPGGLPAVLPPASFFPGAGGVFAGTLFGPALAPYTVTTTDRIRTFNHFFGGNVGFRGDIGFGKWFVQMTGKFAAGYMRSWVDLEGQSTLVAANGLVSTVPGGLFNAPQDLCRHRADRFAIVPEGSISVGCQVFSWLRVTAGYNFLYIDSVIRPTSSLTPVFNPALIPVSPAFTGGGPRNFVPRDVINNTDYHLHGFTAGLQISF